MTDADTPRKCPLCGEPGSPMPHCDRVGCDMGYCCRCGARVADRGGVSIGVEFAEFVAAEDNLMDLMTKIEGGEQ